MMPKVDAVDVIVLGGGPAGLATAIRLTALGMSVIVVERTDYGNTKAGEHITPGAVLVLRKLGLRDELMSQQSSASQGIVSKWQGSEAQYYNYLFSPHGSGINLSRPNFERSFAELAIKNSVRIFRKHRPKIVSFDECWLFELADEEKTTHVLARFAVDATGRAAWLSRAVGCPPKKLDKTVGLVAYCPPRSEQELQGGLLYIEAARNGWWSTAPLRDGRIAATFFTDADLINRKGVKLTDVWRASLEDTKLTAMRLDHTNLLKEIHAVPAQSQISQHEGHRFWLAVGDAALAQDPLSGSGVEYGIRSGTTAADAIFAHFSGNKRALDNYRDKTIDDLRAYLEQYQQIYREVSDRQACGPFWQRRQLKADPSKLKQQSAAFY